MRLAVMICGLAVAGSMLVLGAPGLRAQDAVQVGMGPECPYGYYDYAPYNCAPYGYYGPAWFPHGVFRGAGPWFHGPKDFRGTVDDRFDVRHGYPGKLPKPGERVKRHAYYDFNASGTTDGRGHYRAIVLSKDSIGEVAQRE
ncbi:MAG: hypothetical protein ACRD3F_11200 [Acidobacteriaceae bacterium]